MEKLGIKSTKYTQVMFDPTVGLGVAHRHYVIVDTEGSDVALGSINFQNGPILEAGVNGVTNEDLIAICIDRMGGFQAGPYACKENEMALERLTEALMWLRKRANDREAHGVEGTHQL